MTDPLPSWNDTAQGWTVVSIKRDWATVFGGT
jgi:hypothetical protein